MTPIPLYRIVSSLSRIEGLSHALRENIVGGHYHGAEGILDSLEKDLREAREQIGKLVKQPIPRGILQRPIDLPSYGPADRESWQSG